MIASRKVNRTPHLSFTMNEHPTEFSESIGDKYNWDRYLRPRNVCKSPRPGLHCAESTATQEAGAREMPISYSFMNFLE